MRINIEDGVATIKGPFPRGFLEATAKVSGKKKWASAGVFEFDANAKNVRLFKETFPEADWKDTGNVVEDVERLARLAEEYKDAIYTRPSAKKSATAEGKLKTGPAAALRPIPSKFIPTMTPWDHQESAFRSSAERKEYAVLWEMGTGKSALILRTGGHLFLAGKIGLMVIVAPKGVHEQWIEEQIPEHMMPGLPLNLLIWKKGKKLPEEKLPGLTIVAIHIDALRVSVDRQGNILHTSDGYDDLKALLRLYTGQSMLVIDESHYIKSPTSQRTLACFRLGLLATYRRICTGTPIAKNLIDAWSQFQFLNTNILGHRYFTTFRAEYCVMGGFGLKEIVDHQNVEQFYSLIAPHASRTTKKECLSLPPKVWENVPFELGEEARSHYKTMKEEFMAMIDNEEIVDVTNALTQMLRLHQITCGFIPREDGTLYHTADNARLDTAMNIIDQLRGSVIIWSRFTENVESVAERLEKSGRKVGLYYGGQHAKLNKAAKLDFLSGKIDFLSANSQSGGAGLNLQGPRCENIIYYSNSFRLLDRLQSEDRTHRSGMGASMTIFDIIARRTIDQTIIRNLKKKKELADLTLDTIRRALAEEDFALAA